jgi:MFS family permease
MVVLDSNLVTIALPSIRSELGFAPGGLQWVLGAFGLAFGGALLVAGRAGDVFGHARLLRVGLVSFAAASLAGALAPSAAALVGARAVQGLGAAASFPASLALIAATFEDGAPRNRALGTYGAATSAAFVSGVALGGALTMAAGWRSVLLVNVPIGLLAAGAVGRVTLETPTRPAGASLDPTLAATAMGAAVALLYALGTLARGGGDSGPTALIAAGVLAAGCRTLAQRSPAPLVPTGLASRGALGSASVAAFLTVGTGVGVMFVLTLYLQEVLDRDPLVSGLLLTPLGIAGVAAGAVVPRIVRVAGRVQALVGCLLVQTVGVATLVPIDAHGGAGLVVAGAALLGFGHFGATVAFTGLASQGSGERERGIVMGIVGSAQQLGGAFGLALVAAVATAGSGGALEGFRRALAVAAVLPLLAAAFVAARALCSTRRACG